jgi:hypothetical protein
MSNTDLYFTKLLDILSTSNNLLFAEKNKLWIKRFYELEIPIKNSNLSYLPDIMSLIHPDFLYDQDGFFLGDLIFYNNSRFNTGINETDTCQINSILTNCICQFNYFRDIRGKCQADHLWPHSLGGPSIFENRILLCKYHNVSKSNSIVEAFWRSYPVWLNVYLNKLHNLKS